MEIFKIIKNLEKQTKYLAEQNEKIAKNLIAISGYLKRIIERFQILNEKVFINDHLIRYMLKEKLNMPIEEMKIVESEAKQLYKKAQEEIEEIKKMFDLGNE